MDTSLTPLEVALFSRQCLSPGFGAGSQRVLRGLSVLLVGAGGLGCPAALYLSRSGLARLTIVDGDLVEASNLHRQIAHDAASIGTPKAQSLALACQRGLVSAPGRGVLTEVVGVHAWLTPGTAPSLLHGHHLVVDASDNPSTRYLVNDACVLVPRALGLPRPLPLISGAALGTDGQLSVHHWPGGARGSSCYRCTFPTPPAAAACPPCDEAGVLGPVTGLIGSLMALEVLKCAAAWARGEGGGGPLSWEEPSAGAPPSEPTPPSQQQQLHTPSLPSPSSARLLCLDASEPRLRTLSTASASRPLCPLCATSGPSIASLQDTVAWGRQHGLFAAEPGAAGQERAGQEAAALLQGQHCATGEQIERCRSTGGAPATAAAAAAATAPLLLDVRPALQRSLCAPSAHRAIHMPYTELLRLSSSASGGQGLVSALCALAAQEALGEVLVLCRRGRDSAAAVALLRGAGVGGAVSVRGGLAGWNAGLAVEDCPSY